VIRELHPPTSCPPRDFPPDALPVVDGGPPALPRTPPPGNPTGGDDGADGGDPTTLTASPGPWSEGPAVLAGSGCLPRGHSNNQAEYAALSEGLRAALAAGARRLVCRGDSLLVVQQLAGNFAAGSPRMLPLLARARELARFPGATVAVQHVPRAGNAAADAQANAALDALLALEQAARAAPSAYERAARRVAAALPALDPRRALDLPLEDDFAGAVARAAGEAMGVPPALLRRRMRDAEEAGAAAAAAAAAAPAPATSVAVGGSSSSAAAAAATRLKQWEAAAVAAGWSLEESGGGGGGRAADNSASSSSSSSSTSSSESEEDEAHAGARASSSPSFARLECHQEDAALGGSVTARAGPPVPGATLRTLRWASVAPHWAAHGSPQQRQQQPQHAAQPGEGQGGGGAGRGAGEPAAAPGLAASPHSPVVGGPDVATLAAALAASEGHIMVVRGAHGVPVPLSPEALEWHVEGGRFGAGGAAGDGEGTAIGGGGGFGGGFVGGFGSGDSGGASLSDDAALAAAAAHMPTHLLLFDGASRNNPGRASFGFVLYDLRQAPLAALAGALLAEQQQQEREQEQEREQQQQREEEDESAGAGASSPPPARRRKRARAALGGTAAALASSASLRAVCRGGRSLPYGTSAAQAEYQGLLAGLEAAAAAGVRRLAVRGDSALVVGQLRSRACGSAPAVARLYVRARQLIDGAFERADVALVPRAANGAADQLARRALDLDSALYALLRGDGRSLRLAAARGLAGVASAARLRQVAAEVGVALARPGEGGAGGGGETGEEEAEAEEDGGDARFLQAVLGGGRGAGKGRGGGGKGRGGDGGADESPLPIVLAQLTWRLVSLPAPALLGRLEDKAARLGDPNPWLVQRVRALVAAQRAAVDEALLQRWGVAGGGGGVVGGQTGQGAAAAAAAAPGSGRPKSKKQEEQGERHRAWLRRQLLQPGGAVRQQALVELAGMHPAGAWRPPPMPKQAEVAETARSARLTAGGGALGADRAGGAQAALPLLPPLAAAAVAASGPSSSSPVSPAPLARAYATSSSRQWSPAGRVGGLLRPAAPPAWPWSGVGGAAPGARPHLFAPGRRRAAVATFAVGAARRFLASSRPAAAAVFAALVGSTTLV